MKPTPEHDRVEVLWHDSTIPHRGWVRIEEATSKAFRAIVECVSVGFVLADDKHGMVLAGSVHGTEGAGVVVIPRGQIKQVRRLTPEVPNER